MKKFLCFIVTVLTIFSLAGCRTTNTQNEKLQITTTIFPYYSFAKEICGDNAEITMLLKPGAESHTYDPTTEDILKIQNSDIFIYTGGESDEWVNTILSSVDTSKTIVIKAIDFVDAIHEEHGETQHNEAYDEHIWTSLKNAALISQKISEEICKADSANSTTYKNNTVIFTEKLNALDEDFKETIENSENKTLIFADRFPFSYFAKDYKLKYIAAFPGCSEETEPSIQTMAEMTNTIKQQSIKAVFYIEFSNQKIADTLQRETGTKKLLFHSCHNVSKDEFASGMSYLDLMQQNLENLKEALK